MLAVARGDADAVVDADPPPGGTNTDSELEGVALPVGVGRLLEGVVVALVDAVPVAVLLAVLLAVPLAVPVPVEVGVPVVLGDSVDDGVAPVDNVVVGDDVRVPDDELVAVAVALLVPVVV